MRVIGGTVWLTALMFGAVAWADVHDLPDAEVLAEWGVVEWIDTALQQAELIENEVDREEVHINVLMAMCQVPGQHARVERLADESSARILARGVNPFEPAYQLPLVIYAYARIGEMDKAQETLAQIQGVEEKVAGLNQMGWGTAERGDQAATEGVIADAETLIQTIEDEEERGWQRSGFPVLLWIIEQEEAAEALTRAIELEDARADAWLLLGEMAMDFGDRDAADNHLDEAAQIMATLPDGGAWQAASFAALIARLGQPDKAGAMMIRLGGDPYGLVTVGSAVARASHDAGDPDAAESMLNQIRSLTKTVRLEPGFTEPTDLAFLWWDVSIAAHGCGRMDLVKRAWDESNTPLNRGMIAAGIAVEMAWIDWLEQQR